MNEASPKSNYAEAARVALDALWGARFRAFLAILGVTVGVGVVVAIGAVIAGIREEVMEVFEAAGPRNFAVMPFDFTAVRIVPDGSGRPPWWDKPPITNDELDRMRELPSVQSVVGGFEFDASIRRDTDWLRVQWNGSSVGWAQLQSGDFVAGRNFTVTEARQARRVAVLTQEVAQDVFGERDPIGRRFRVYAGRRATNELFTVVGVFAPKANVFGDLQTRYAVTPLTTAEKRLKARTRFNFVNASVEPRDDVSVEQAQDDVTEALRSMRGLGPGEENDFAIITSDQMLSTFESFTQVFFLVMLGLSSAGLMVGGIGVIGIMLISVSERTREIGIRKALGATRREIMWQFLFESSMLTVLGAGMGLLAGWGISQGISAISPLPATIPLWSVAASLLLAALTGIGCGMLPARRAAKLDPVDALRYE